MGNVLIYSYFIISSFLYSIQTHKYSFQDTKRLLCLTTWQEVSDLTRTLIHTQIGTLSIFCWVKITNNSLNDLARVMKHNTVEIAKLLASYVLKLPQFSKLLVIDRCDAPYSVQARKVQSCKLSRYLLRIHTTTNCLRFLTRSNWSTRVGIR